MNGRAKAVAEAATLAMRAVVADAVSGARSNIAAAGFTGTWITGMKGFTIPKGGGVSPSPVGVVFHTKNFAAVFERGSTIRGKPLLWIPIEQNLGTLTGAARMTPRKFIASGRKLRSVKSAKGRPLLVSNGLPVFFGIPTVTLRKRFNIVEIIRRAVDRFGEFYFKNFRD